MRGKQAAEKTGTNLEVSFLKLKNCESYYSSVGKPSKFQKWSLTLLGALHKVGFATTHVGLVVF